MSNINKIIATNIAKMRIFNKFTQKELADLLNVTKTTITNYEAATRSPSFEMLDKMATIFKVPIESFFSIESQFVDKKLIIQEETRIPIISHASAGFGRVLEEEILGFVQLPPQITTKCDFATYIDGNSMEPKILDGDIVFVKKNIELKNGDIGLFSLNEQLYVKQWKINVFTKEYSLVSLNNEYPILKIKNTDNFCIIGKIICKIDYNF